MKLIFKNEKYNFYSKGGKLFVTDPEDNEQDLAEIIADPAFANVVRNANAILNNEKPKAAGDSGSGEDKKS